MAWKMNAGTQTLAQLEQTVSLWMGRIGHSTAQVDFYRNSVVARVFGLTEMAF